MSKEEAGVLLSKLRPREVEALTRELMRLGSVELDDVDNVMNEFHGLMTAQHFIGRGGVDFAREILAAGLGEDKAGDILSRLNVVYTEVPFASLRNADVRQLVTFLKDEHAQIIALVLAHLTAGAVGRGAVRLRPGAAGRGRAPDRHDGPHLAGDGPPRRGGARAAGWARSWRTRT